MTTSTRLTTTTDGVAFSLGISRARTLLGPAILALGAAVVAAVLLFRPWPARNTFLYHELARLRDPIWTGILIDSLAFAAVAIGMSLVVAKLTRTRGGLLANLGAAVVTAGAVLFAMGAFAFASLVWYATDPAALPVADGTRLLEYAVANPEHGILLQGGGFILYTLGTLLLAVALMRAGSVPYRLPIAMIALTIAQFATSDRVLDFVQIAAMTLLVILAALVLRQSAASS